ncbi:MAG: hypothetical protein FWF63_04945 [Fibromonadales bacterium]|nr:hypothetical protein [Fibromonadales bacterium]
MRCRFNSFVLDMDKFLKNVSITGLYKKVQTVFYYRLDLFRVRVFYYNPMGVI